MRVEDERSPRPLTRRFLAAAESYGIRYIDDYNGPEQDGAALCQVTQRNGKRWSTNDAYLRPVRDRGNLQVVTGATVSRVLIQGGRATGVVCQGRFGREHVLEARREVILAAGAFGSPQLLMLSGIGPAEQLRALGITVEVDAPEVGENLQDHPFNTVVCEVEADSLGDAEHPRYLAEWLLRRSGPLTSTVAEAFAFVRTRPGPAGARRPVPLRARLLRRPRGGGVRRARDHARAGADHAQEPRPALRCARPTRPTSRGSSPTRSPSPRTSPRCWRGCGSRAS